MSRLNLMLSLLLCLSSVCAAQAPRIAAGSSSAENVSAANAKVLQIGVRSYPDGSHIPIWAIMLGDTANAEHVAHSYVRFGPHGLNATLWTHVDGTSQWSMSIYRRPSTLDEALEWYKNAEAFTSHQTGDYSLLPAGFAKLSADVIKSIDFIIRYNDGSIKAYLYPGTSRADVEYAAALVGGAGIGATSAR
jgi:hypothetical protein